MSTVYEVTMKSFDVMGKLVEQNKTQKSTILQQAARIEQLERELAKARKQRRKFSDPEPTPTKRYALAIDSNMKLTGRYV